MTLLATHLQPHLCLNHRQLIHRLILQPILQSIVPRLTRTEDHPRIAHQLYRTRRYHYHNPHALGNLQILIHTGTVLIHAVLHLLFPVV
jgi:hypothetical protein